ncbi:MAG: thioredoxin family protein [Curvibacter sp.]
MTPANAARRRWLLAAAALPWFGPSARAAELPLAHNFQQELAAALARREPLVVMVSLEGCPYCRIVRDQHLEPRHRLDSLTVVQVDMRSRNRVLDWQGQPVTHDELVRLWKVRVAPTVLLLGRGGAEVAERLVGGYIPDFYAAYLEQRLEQARASLR